MKPPHGRGPSPDPREPRQERLGAMALVGVGAELGLTVAALAFVGWWLDQKWETGPWMTVTGACLGIVGGMYNLWKHVRKYL